eukprot:scaffold2250_cov40-Prasinocladus_malaysianus.AAC.1
MCVRPSGDPSSRKKDLSFPSQGCVLTTDRFWKGIAEHGLQELSASRVPAPGGIPSDEDSGGPHSPTVPPTRSPAKVQECLVPRSQ